MAMATGLDLSIKNFMTYSVDFHIHSNYSADGFDTPEAIIITAMEKGLSLIAITDHFVDRAFYELVGQGEVLLGKGFHIVKHETFLVVSKDSKQLIILKGKEVSTSEGFHILGLAYEGQVKNFKNLEDTLREIKSKKGIAIIPHPCATIYHGIGGGNVKKLATTDMNLFDAIEIFNANDLFPCFWVNTQAAFLARRFNLPGVAVSDAHEARHVGYSSTLLPQALDLTSSQTLLESLIKALQSNNLTLLRKYIPVSDFFHWFVFPKIKLLFTGKHLRIQPPADYEKY